ncbi:NupC/NupG family nucleoside CNT transporter [Oculatella sp. LEGE 06141]|uniref:NupC/NupG family nucleoside CNT transporter n=1 Tax=Oculatella sp. LEGE 06141 TaxID=1828648 RepID=UPI00187F3FF9|nr:NupC/NupG family nucleoside CNT transporter [Oculatella sp. LEGE 06141]MBE9177140.1 NupC/NupG family nucleoside CNT transporter [Oculatella sp. LEGE 06141]
MERLISLLGLVVFVGIAYGLSVDRKSIRWQPVLWGVALQFMFALFILRTSIGLRVFQWLGNAVGQFLNFSDAGAQFVFGDNFEDFFFAFKVLPTIIFFSAFISVLYHYGILQQIVRWIAWLMMRTMKTSGSESLSCAGNIFVGQTEAPLLIKPYIASMTLSELHAVMTGGFATIAGGVLVAYVSFGIPAEHLIAASVMSAPAALAISKIMYPETEDSPTRGDVSIKVERTTANAIDAITTGALDGLKLVLNIAAMIIAFLALLAMVNAVLGWLGNLVGISSLSLELILSYFLAPLAWLMGVPWADCGQVGILLGKKTILNEFIAYLDLQALIAGGVTTDGSAVGATPAISERAVVIATYALCGFANIGSIGIQIGGIGGISPERQPDLAKLGVRAMVAGSLACFMTAAIAGLLL